MPEQTQVAVNWALEQEGVVVDGEIDKHLLVENVREYFNTHSIAYGTFSFDDVVPYLPVGLLN